MKIGISLPMKISLAKKNNRGNLQLTNPFHPPSHPEEKNEGMSKLK